MGRSVVLAELRIRDFAVIETAAIEFGAGFNVLTGETGAGKSIIVDALSAALGARLVTDVIRTGAERALVEARFDPPGTSAAAAWLRDQGFEGDELVVARDFGASGRSRAWINGRPVTVGMLRDLGDLLVEVTGQHEGQRLLRPATHLDLLDAFAGERALRLRAEASALVRRRGTLRDERAGLLQGERERIRQADVLAFQVKEVDAARLQPGEEEELLARRTRLANAERLSGAALAAYAALYEAEGHAAVDLLGRARGALREAAALDAGLAPLAGRIDSLADELSDVAHELSRYAASLDTRPEELEMVEERLALIAGLKRKYGDGVDAILAFRAEAAASLQRLQSSDARLVEIDRELAVVEGDLARCCASLTRLRRTAAGRLEDEAQRTLRALEMHRARLGIAFSRDPDPDGIEIDGERLSAGPTGADRVEFLFAPTQGEEARPLARIASGGELSRVMLALRHALAEAGTVPVMVCDEVDAGIGSRAAGAVGKLLAAVARGRQVLCVTHLPQIASLADRHVWVEKQTVAGRARVRVHHLSPQERVDEIARMLGGRQPSEIAREHAAELLARAGGQAPAGAGTKTARGGRA